MINPIYEKMHKFQNDFFIVRIWETIDFGLNEWKENDIVSQIKKLVSLNEPVALGKNFAYKVFSIIRSAQGAGKNGFDNIAACEVLDTDGNGYLFYPDWK